MGEGEYTNNLLRKSPTSLVVEGPPMFMKTMAVGPLDDVASWVTGGTTVAIDRFGVEGEVRAVRIHVLEGAANWKIEAGEARLVSWERGARRDMMSTERLW